MTTASTENNSQVRNHMHQIKGISQKTLTPWAYDLAIDWLIIGLAIYASYRLHNLFVNFLTIIVIGNRQHALAVMGHEGTHYTLHKNMKINDFLTNIFCFWPILMTVDGYRSLHYKHHKETGTINDPELLHKKARAPQWDLPLNKKRVAFYALKDLVGYSLQDLIIILTFSKPRNKKDLLPVFSLHIAFITISIVMGGWWIPALWYFSMATTFMMFFRFRLWIEHQGTFDTQRIYLSKLQSAVLAPHNIWLHWEHHRFPTVPYHNLPKAREVMPQPVPISLSKLIDDLSTTAHWPSGATLESFDTSP